MKLWINIYLPRAYMYVCRFSSEWLWNVSVLERRQAAPKGGEGGGCFLLQLSLWPNNKATLASAWGKATLMTSQLDASYIKMMERRRKSRMNRSKGGERHMLFIVYHTSSIVIHLISKHISQSSKRADISQLYAHWRMCLLLLQG